MKRLILLFSITSTMFSQVVVGQTTQSTIFQTLWQNQTGIQSVVVKNIGQVTHQIFITVTGSGGACPAGAVVRIEGSADNVNFVIMDTESLAIANAFSTNVVGLANGLYPFVRIRLPNTASYTNCLTSAWYFGSKNPLARTNTLGDARIQPISAYDLINMSINTTTLLAATNNTYQAHLGSIIVGTAGVGSSLTLTINGVTALVLDTTKVGSYDFNMNLPLGQSTQVTTTGSTPAYVVILGQFSTF